MSRRPGRCRLSPLSCGGITRTVEAKCDRSGKARSAAHEGQGHTDMPRVRPIAARVTESAGSDPPHGMRSLSDVILAAAAKAPKRERKRPGRKPGVKTGPHKAPALSKTSARQVMRDKAVTVVEDANETGALLPLDHMLEVLRDRKQPESRRDDMAKAAAPYLHPRLVAAEVRSQSLVHVTINITGDDAALL